MGSIVLVDQEDRVLQKVEQAVFSNAAFELVKNSFAAFNMVPCICENRGGDVVLRCQLGQMTSAAKRLPNMDSIAFMGFLEQLLQVSICLDKTPGLLLGAALMQFENVYCDQAGRPFFLYTFQTQAEDSQTTGRKVLAQLRKLQRSQWCTPQIAKIWECIDDPFAELSSLEAIFAKTRVAAMPAASPGPHVSAAHTVSAMPSNRVNYIPQPVVPLGQEQGVINATRYSLDMAPKHVESAKNGVAVKYGMDVPTAGIPVSTFVHKAEPQANYIYGMDQSTTDGNPSFTPEPQKPPSPPEPPPEKPRLDPMPKSKPVKPLPPKPQHSSPPMDDTQRYSQQMAAFKRHLFLALSALLIIITLALIVTTFGGYVGLWAVLLVTALVTAVLVNRGILSGLKPPRKPKKTESEPQAPNIEAVFSVRIKLKSTNLTSQVEITIRKSDQLIGSDAGVCPTPLKYSGISRAHCRIISVKTAGHTDYFIKDEGSKNGTELNGQWLVPGTDYQLHLGDQITLAHRYVFIVCSDAY